MFQIINSFIDGEITDEQCKHCLAATHLGSQYVFISDQAIERILEAKGLLIDEETEIERQYEIFKRIRNQINHDKNDSPRHSERVSMDDIELL